MIRSRRSLGTPPRGGTSRGECAQYSAQPCRGVGSTPRSHMATGLLMLHSCAGSRAANAGCAVLLSKRGVCVRRGCRCRGAAAVVCVRLCSRVIRSFISSPHAPRALRAPRFSSRRIKKLRVIFLFLVVTAIRVGFRSKVCSHLSAQRRQAAAVHVGRRGGVPEPSVR